MAKKNKNALPEIDKKTRKALTETKVNIHDGWADDVPLVYDKDGWKPDEADLVMVDINNGQEPPKKKVRRQKHVKYDDKPKPVVAPAKQESKKRTPSHVTIVVPNQETDDADDNKETNEVSLVNSVADEVKDEKKPVIELAEPKEPVKEEKVKAPKKTKQHAKVIIELPKTVTESEKEEDKPSAEELARIIEEDSTVKKKGKVHPFRLFLIIWLGVLAITIGVLLSQFYNFLERYEAAYEASRPALNMDSLIAEFYELDMDTIYNLMTVKPETNAFETEENVKNYMYGLLENKYFKYAETPYSSRELPEYYVYADGYIVAKVELRKVVGNSLEYGFPIWYISNFEFYTDAQYSVRVEMPSNYSLSVNGILMSDEYAYETGIEIDDKVYFENYIADFPTRSKYYVNGFYEEPSLYAISCFGTNCDINWNMERGIYEVPFAQPDDAEEIMEYAISVVTDYAFFMSQDADDNALDGYFPEGEELLNMLKASTSRQFFTRHSSTYMENETVNEFTMYTPECVYIGISMDQHIYMWSGDEIIPIIGNFCYVKIDGEWKVCAIKY